MARLVFSLNIPTSHGFNLSPRNYPSLFVTQTRAPRFRAVRCQANPESSETQEKLVVDNVASKEVESSVAASSSSGVTVDMTSSKPELAREIYAEAKRRNCWAVDAPVSGGDAGARTLAIFAGGDSEIVEWLSPVMKKMGIVRYMGGAGSGQSCKIGNQICAESNLVGLAEGIVFAEKACLDPVKWLEAVKDGAVGSRLLL